MKTINDKPINENLRMIRGSMGLSQLAFGKRFGLTRDQISSMEIGRTPWPREVLRRIASEIPSRVFALKALSQAIDRKLEEETPSQGYKRLHSALMTNLR